MFKSKKEKLEKESFKEETSTEELDSTAIPVNTEEPVSETAAEEEGTTAEEIESANLVKVEKQINLLRDQLLRKAAEFENYKRRTEADLTNVYRFANEGLIHELLPVLDDFERMMKTDSDKLDAQTLKKGMDLVFGKFKAILEKNGLKEIDAAGKPFDVALHDALLQKEDDTVDADTVTEEVEKGYWLKDKVLRHSKVIVSRKSGE